MARSTRVFAELDHCFFPGRLLFNRTKSVISIDVICGDIKMPIINAHTHKMTINFHAVDRVPIKMAKLLDLDWIASSDEITLRPSDAIL